MTSNSLRGLGWACGFAFAMATVVAGCGGETDGPVGGSESHFLAYCEDSCGDGLDCIAGVCTRGCVVDESSCSDLAPDAECTADSIEPGAVAVCDLPCEAHEDCSVLSAKHTCDAGFCRKSAEPGDGGGLPNDGACDVDGTLVPSGSLVPNPDSCGYCTCDDGDLACDDAPCDGVLPLPACDQIVVPASFQAAAIEILGFLYVRDDEVLEIDVGHAGGCEEHTYGLCYSASSDSAAELRLAHDGNGDTCEAYPQTTLRFDLTSVRKRLSGDLMITQDDPEELPQVLNATVGSACDDGPEVAEPQVAELLASLDKSCEVAADCVWARDGGHCWSAGCGVIANVKGAEAIDALTERLNQNVCVGDCAFEPPNCDERGELDCVEGVCTEVFP